MKKLVYKRVLLKLSGETLGASGAGIDIKKLQEIIEMVRALRESSVELAIVIGGGNIWRKRNQGGGMDEVAADFIGMLATTMNALAIKQALVSAKINSVVQSAVACDVRGVEKLNQQMSLRYLKQGKVIIFAGGTGKPFFTTDTAAAQRAKDIHAEVIIKASTVDGVYTADPKRNKSAKKYTQVSFKEAIRKHLGIMDLSALKICQKNKIKIIVCKFNKANIIKAVDNYSIGTLVV